MQKMNTPQDDDTSADDSCGCVSVLYLAGCIVHRPPATSHHPTPLVPPSHSPGQDPTQGPLRVGVLEFSISRDAMYTALPRPPTTPHHSFHPRTHLVRALLRLRLSQSAGSDCVCVRDTSLRTKKTGVEKKTGVGFLFESRT